MNTAKLIEGMIPDELRLAPHPDAALVNEAIATVLTAMDESDALTLAGKSRDVRKALLAFYNGTYVKHIAEEDELWTSMQAKAEKYRPEAHLITTRPMKNGFSRYSYTMDNEKGTIVAMQDDGKYVAEYMVFGTDIPVASAAMDSEREALASLFMGRGALVVIDGSPLIPMPAKVPVIEETATETVTEEPAHPPIADTGIEVIKTKVNVLEDKPSASGTVELKNLQKGTGPVWRNTIVFEVYVDGELMRDESGDTDYGRLIPDLAKYHIQMRNGNGTGPTIEKAISDASKKEPYASRVVSFDESFSESNPLVEATIRREAEERLSHMRYSIQNEISGMMSRIQEVSDNDSLKADARSKRVRELQAKYQPEIDKLNDQLSDISSITVEDIIRQAREGK